MAMDAEELLKRIHELEEGQAELKREVSELLPTTGRHGDDSSSRRHHPKQPSAPTPTMSARTTSAPHADLVRRAVVSPKQLLRSPERPAAGVRWQYASSSRRRLPPSPVGHAGLSARHHVMAMQSLGQAVHILDLRGKVLYWSRCAEHLYGYAASEAIGRDVTELLVHRDDIVPATNIIGNVFTGKCWRGKFPVKNKSGKRFSIVTCGTPLHDDDGRMIGLICLSEDTRILQEIIELPSSGCYYDSIN